MFWLGFHPRDCAELFARLIAKYPDQPSGVCFDFRDVYRVAKATFSGNHLLGLELSEPYFESREGRRSECAQERWVSHEEHNPQRADPNYSTHDCQRHPSYIDVTLRDTQHQCVDACHLPSPEAESSIIQCKKPTREEEDHELEDLMKHMHGLPTCKESYAELYAQCACRFPNVTQNFPEPVFAQHVPVCAPTAPIATFFLQASAPLPPPFRQP